jgi:catechol 2,3-dioxygenase-like lactoylglutathione lyase family enzyme
MISSVDHIIIAVKDLDQAISDYEKILGIAPCWKGKHNELGTENALFNFENTYLELLSPCDLGPGTELINSLLVEKGDHLAGIALGTKNIEHAKEALIKDGYGVEISSGEATNEKDEKIRRWKNIFLPNTLSRELFIFIIEHTEGSLQKYENQDTSKVKKLDHVVINTQDADNFIHIYKDVYKIRLALDKTIEHWKRRMLFFRTNATTIEVIEEKDKKESADELWGLAWEVDSIEDAHKRLVSNNVEVTPIKEGLKKGTLVATIKSHTCNVPTLLIEHRK